ncbi:hypothetical protein Hanom_Chr09g00825181 [Helianthus anomalus]
MLLDRTGQSILARGKDSDKGHNVPCTIDAETTTGSVVEKMATFLRENRIAKAMSNRTVVYESHVRSFWDTTRFDELDNLIHVDLRKKDKDGKDVDVEIEFGVADVRRVLDLQDSDDDPTIMSERLVKGLWCRMGFTGYINGKMYKRCFSKAYRFLMHCMVHSMSHRKGAYDEVSDYIMNIVASLVLNKRYNISQVLFEYMKENCQAKGDKYIMYPRFIMMIINDKIKDLPKDSDDKDVKTKELICRIKNKEYVAPKNDKWRHDDSNSDDETERMKDMVEKKTRWWCIKDGKRKRTPKSSPAVVIKDAEKGSSKEPQRRLVDETVLDPSVIIEQGADLLKESLESYLKKNEEVAAQKAKSSFIQEEDKESSNEEDSPYDPEKSKKQRKKRKAAPAGVIPRNVRAKKCGAESQKDKDGKKDQHVQKEKTPVAEIPKEPKVQRVEEPVAEIIKETGDDDDVEITGAKPACSQSIPQEVPESSQPKEQSFDFNFDTFDSAAGIFTEDLPDEDPDMFHDQAVKELLQKVNKLEKEKAKTELERDILKKQVDLLMKGHDQLREELFQQNEEVNKARNEAEDNLKLFDLLSGEISELSVKIKELESVNQTLNQLLSEM